MNDFSRFLQTLSKGQRWAMGLGVLVILAGTTALGIWALRVPYGVLFSDLGGQDAAAIVQELDKLKIPYEIGADGQAVLVPEASVHKTRMALMGRQLPLQGAVGFELFNNADFGASDFVQKVNYQRALQGELTRTIASLEQVQSVRVHLALPEQALFKKDATKPKASVTVATRPGKQLSGSQVLGIQRLVAASVADVRVEDVTVLDQHGVTLSRAGAEEGGGMAAGAQFESKRELEEHLTRKAGQVLDRLFGAGAATVTVDVALNHQQTKVTTEEVLSAAHLPKDQLPVGVITRERSSSRDASEAGKPSGATSSQEVDYATGKRVEQTLSPSGHVSRIHVAVVVKGGLGEQDLARVRDVVAASVGAQAVRGDVVAVYALAASQDAAASAVLAPAAPPDRRPTPAPSAAPARADARGVPGTLVASVLAGLMGLLAMVAVARYWLARPARPQEEASSLPLTPEQRQAVLESVQRWLRTPEHPHGV